MELQLKQGAWPPVATLKSSNPLLTSREQLLKAEQLREQGQLEQARATCEPLVVRNGDYFGALHTLGLIYADLHNYPMAVGFLVRAAMLHPRSWKTLTALAGVYLKLEALEMAAHTLEQALRIKPRDPGILLTLAEVYVEEREYELARDAYREALEIEPGLEGAATGLGRCYGHLGQHEDAASLYDGLLKRGQLTLSVVNGMNSLPPALVTLDVLKLLDKVKKRPQYDEADYQNSVSFLRAQILDKTGRHADAWQHLVPANREIFSEEDARKQHEAQTAKLDWLRDNKIKAAPAGNGGHPISLFILGPSRSGKTTMESLVARLDGVKRGYENPIVENAVRRAFHAAGLLNVGNFDILPDQFLPSARENYLDELGRRAGPVRVFTNTHPAHIHSAARIATAFPDVRFLFVKRDPDDTALRIYFRRYRTGNAYGYDLKYIREHIAWYHEMIDLLAEKLPKRVRVVHYEDMVADPAGTLAVAAELCGLPMTEEPLPEIGDDRGCAEPYRQFMDELLAA